MKCWKCNDELEKDESYVSVNLTENISYWYCKKGGHCSYYYDNDKKIIDFISFEDEKYRIHSEGLYQAKQCYIAVGLYNRKKGEKYTYFDYPIEFLDPIHVMDNVKKFMSKIDSIMLLA